jgi:glutathione S-transferase
MTEEPTMTHEKAEYELYYWPSIPGRGEFVRLALEEAGARYRDVAREPKDEGGGVPALLAMLKTADGEGALPFAPPILKQGTVIVSQTSAILAYLGPRLGLVPDDELGRLAALEHQLTVADLVGEAHDVHHPIGGSLYYEDQKPEALRHAKEFIKERIPKFLGHFERALERNTASSGRHLVGRGLSYPDLSLFQVIAGLRYAFPHAMKKHEASSPRAVALHDAVADRPKIAAYLKSKRRLPFNEDGIFRHYPELDA